MAEHTKEFKVNIFRFTKSGFNTGVSRCLVAILNYLVFHGDSKVRKRQLVKVFEENGLIK